MRGRKRITAVLVVLLLAVTGCESAPREINYGQDGCAHCRMTITEREFASQLLNRQGRAFMFDSVECLAAYEIEATDDLEIHSMWVPDFRLQDGWIPAGEAVFLKSETLRSPMGLSLSAYPDREAALPFFEEYGGELLNWEQVRELVRREWMGGGS